MKHKTILELIASSINKAADFNHNAEERPAAVLWTDEPGLWKPLIPMLGERMPNLFELGDWNPAMRTGPAYWLKCVIARKLNDMTWPVELTPVLYLPGVSHSTLRQVNICPVALHPIAELQFRGAYWAQANGKDWTPFAFLTSTNGGLGLDVAADSETRQALLRSLKVIAAERFVRFEGERIDSDTIGRLLEIDVPRDLLVWMDDPKRARETWDGSYWVGLCNQVVKRLKFDPNKDDPLTAAERTAAQDADWKAVWTRYCESPANYPNVVKLLQRLPDPADMFEDHSAFPAYNRRQEELLQTALAEFVAINHVVQARERIAALEAQHGARRGWVWAELGRSRLVRALEHLARIATLSVDAHGAPTPGQMQAKYEQTAWEIDVSMIDALAAVEGDAQTKAVEAALAAVYKPWLEAHAESFQAAVRQHSYPLVMPPKDQGGEPGLAVFFVDGLRYDAGRRLSSMLASRGAHVTLGSSWTAIPSVTASGKVLASPAAIVAIGDVADSDFEPRHKVKKQPLKAPLLRKTLQDMGWQVLLEKSECGDPDGKAWVENGDLDHYGHEHQLRLAKDLTFQLDRVVERVEQLLAAGWKRIRIVTDHGWLLVPGKLDRVQLEKELTETTWGRAAKLKPGSPPTPLTFPWTWCDEVQIALAPGAKSFKAGEHYSHGGLSIQESLTPVLEVSGRASAGTSATIKAIRWTGLRLRVDVTGEGKVTADLRTRAGDPESSVVKSEEVVDGKVTLTVEDDGLEGMSAVLVLLDEGNQVLAKQAVVIRG